MPIAPGAADATTCPQCRQQSPRFETALALGTYDDSLRRLRAARSGAGRRVSARLRRAAGGESPVAARSLAGRCGRGDSRSRAHRFFRATHVPEVLAEAIAAGLSTAPFVPEGLTLIRQVKPQHNLKPRSGGGKTGAASTAGGGNVQLERRGCWWSMMCSPPARDGGRKGASADRRRRGGRRGSGDRPRRGIGLNDNKMASTLNFGSARGSPLARWQAEHIAGGWPRWGWPSRWFTSRRKGM